MRFVFGCGIKYVGEAWCMVQRVVLYQYYLEVMVRRFLSVFLLMGGLLMGSGVNAADLGTYSVDCTTFNQPFVDFVNP